MFPRPIWPILVLPKNWIFWVYIYIYILGCNYHYFSSNTAGCQVSMEYSFSNNLVFIQLHIIMYLLFLRRPQQPAPPAAAPPPPPARQRPRRRHNMWVRPWLLQREGRGPTTTLWLNCMPQPFQDSAIS